jgi:hypothetical protein
MLRELSDISEFYIQFVFYKEEGTPEGVYSDKLNLNNGFLPNILNHEYNDKSNTPLISPVYELFYHACINDPYNDVNLEKLASEQGLNVLKYDDLFEKEGFYNEYKLLSPGYDIENNLIERSLDSKNEFLARIDKFLPYSSIINNINVYPKDKLFVLENEND